MIDNICIKCVHGTPCDHDEFPFGERGCAIVGKLFDPQNPPKRPDVAAWLHRRYNMPHSTGKCPAFAVEKRKGFRDRRVA